MLQGIDSILTLIINCLKNNFKNTGEQITKNVFAEPEINPNICNIKRLYERIQLFHPVQISTKAITYYWTFAEIETYKVFGNLIGLVAKQKCPVVWAIFPFLKNDSL